MIKTDFFFFFNFNHPHQRGGTTVTGPQYVVSNEILPSVDQNTK